MGKATPITKYLAGTLMNLLTANDTDGEYPNSYYASTASFLPLLPPAKGTMTCDICIVGAGYTGLSAALHLAKEGFKVIVLEAQRVGFGASGRNGGQVGTGQRLDQQKLEKALGLKHARELWEIAQDSVKLVKDLSTDMPDCSVVPGIIHASHRYRFVKGEHAYVDHLQEVYGYTNIKKLSRDELLSLVNSQAYYGGYLDLGGGHIDPLRYALGLAKKAQNAGAIIHEKSTVTSINYGTKVKVKTLFSSIKADYVVLACNGYLGSLNKDISETVMPINNFIAATKPMTASQQAAIIKNDYAVADSKFVVNYFRFSPDRRLLFGGSESYGYRFPKDISAAVKKPMLKIFPQLINCEFDYSWGGTLGISTNRMPYFKKIKSNVLSASGYSGHGVAMATMGGKLIAMAIAGQAEKFDIMASIPSSKFPGGTKLQTPLLILAMLWFSLRDHL